MLYVFLVDTGRMMTFDMNLALENVSVLKEVIQRAVKVPPEKQVLLISGGEELRPDMRVCQYTAGTDTNPIFLFFLTTIEGQTPPSPSIDYGADTDLKEQVEGALNMPASYNTVVARAQLAQQFHEHSRDQTRICQQLVHDQHLQQQGWAAVVANLEDLISDFKKTFQGCEQSFNDFFKSREEKFAIIENFDEDLKLLSRIPVLPALLTKSQDITTNSEDTKTDNNIKEESETDEEVSSSIREEVPTAMTLLEWISASDTKSSVEEIAQICLRGLQQTDQHMLEVLAGDVSAVMTEADRPQMKEIKGLEDRLFGLEQLMHDANKIVQEQNSFAQALIQNQNRAGKMNDQSIFPDLCSSHRKNLMHMLKNHQKVQDIKRRCIKAKEELSENLHHRLKWIMYIERKISYTSSKLMMHHEAIRRLTSSLQVMEQIHRAPRTYVSAITEVARRHQFSSSFVQWATHLSVESGDVWEREVSTRKQFLNQFSQHFLVSLFPGLDDLPPNFATQAPDKFDDTLPKLTPENIEELRQILPELASLLVVGEVAAIPPLLQAAMRNHNAPSRKISRESNGSTLGKEGSGEVFASAYTTTNSVTLRITPERDSHYTAKHLIRPHTLSREQSEAAIGEAGESDQPAEDEECSLMEVRSDTRSMKTKHHFPATETDNKQMKLDQGQDTARIKLDTDLHQRPCRSQHNHHHLSSVSPQDNITPLIQPSPESQQELCEFVTAEFYIDESMPSSYTESNDAASDITASSSRGLPGHGGNMVKTHHVITAELQRQLEEKNEAILIIQSELGASQSEVERLSERLNALSTLDCKDQVVNLKDELSRLRLQVKEDGSSYMKYLSELSSNLVDTLLQIQNRSSASEQVAVQEALVAARDNHETLQKELQATVELQVHKLTDATREVEVYQEQLHRHQETIQQQSTEFEEAKRQLIEEKVEAVKQLTLEHELEMCSLKEQLQEDDNAHQEELSNLTEVSNITFIKHEAVKQLTLEHELEMCSLKEQFQEDDNAHQEELNNLTEKLKSLEMTLEKAENERASLEKNFQEKFEAHFQEEKDKIVQILEVSFTEREKKALDVLRDQLVKEHQEHVNRLLNEKEELLRNKISSMQSALSVEWQSKVDLQRQEMVDQHQEHITKLQHSWEQEKDAFLADKLSQVEKQFRIEKDAEVENVRQQYKMELEGLRSRFRMMTTASCDKSPSETSLHSLERMESNRADSVDLGTHEAALARLREELHREHSAAMEADRQLLEQQHFQQNQVSEKKHQEIVTQEKKRIETEKQNVFNDAIRSVSQDKERVIEDLRLRVELLTDETEKLRRMMNAAATDSPDQIMQAMAAENHSLKERCETLHKEVVRLENELLRAKRMSFVCERQQDLNASFTEGAVGGAQMPTSPETVRKLQLENQELRDKLSRSTSSLVERGRISISSCVQGEAVLLVWDEMHLHYRVLLEAHPHLHFLHSDSYQSLGLHKGDVPPDTPRKMYVTAEVVSKEFCQAKKDENRFRVPKGTRFYRVQAKLWEGEEKARRETARDQGRDQLVQSQIITKEQQKNLSQSQSSSQQ